MDRKGILQFLIYPMTGLIDIKNFVKYCEAINLRIFYKLEDNTEGVDFDYEKKLFKGFIKGFIPLTLKNRFFHEINPKVLKRINPLTIHPRKISFDKGKPIIKLHCGLPLDGPVIKLKNIRKIKFDKPIKYSDHFKPKLLTLEDLGESKEHTTFSSETIHPSLKFLEDQFTIFDDIITSKTVLINSVHCANILHESTDNIKKFENLKSLVCVCNNGVIDKNSSYFHVLERSYAGIHPYCVECNKCDYHEHDKLCPYYLTKEELCLECNKLKEIPIFVSPFKAR